MLLLGAVILLAFLLVAAMPTAFTPYGLKDMFKAWQPPSGEHLLGTNALGYDI